MALTYDEYVAQRVAEIESTRKLNEIAAAWMNFKRTEGELGYEDNRTRQAYDFWLSLENPS